MLSVRLAFLSLMGISLIAQHRYPATGLVLAVDRSNQTVTVSHQDIPGLMGAMAMPFAVRAPKLLDGLRAGESVAFTLAVGKKATWIDEIRVVRFDSAERDPVLAGRLKTMDLVVGAGQPAPLEIGRKADFTLTDQDGRSVKLSAFAGKVVALDFIYTRCPLPDYCFRLSNNFGRLQKRFAGQDNLVLLTVTFDPVHDAPEELARYAKVWKADARKWHFLTGSPAEIQRVCGLFGVQYWPDEGVFTHTLHTAVLDRDGKLVANLEGNKFTAQQLGDLVQTVMIGWR